MRTSLVLWAAAWSVASLVRPQILKGASPGGAATAPDGISTGNLGKNTATYRVVDIGPHTRTWERTATTSSTNAVQRTTAKTSTYVELAAGIGVLDPATGKYVEANPNFVITTNGFAVANRCQHQVIVSPNLNDPEGPVDVQMPDGQRFRGGVLGLNLFDPDSGSSLQVSSARDVTATQTAPNELVWFDAFEGLKADVRIRNERGGVHQEVILKEKITADQLAKLGFGPSSRLEVWTEVNTAPVPQIQSRDTTRKSSRTASPTDKSPVDQQIDFGSMSFGRSAIIANQRMATWPHGLREWHREGAQNYLIEAFPYLGLLPLLQDIPVKTAGLQQKPGSTLIAQRSPPLRKLAAQTGRREIARFDPSRRLGGSPPTVLDYALNLNSGSLTNFSFAGGCYFISGAITLYGTTTILGNSVIKFSSSPTNYPTLQIRGTLQCLTDRFQMAVLTSQDDDANGIPIDGSTGTPVRGNAFCFDADRAGTAGTNWVLQYLRFAYAQAGFAAYDEFDTFVSHCQFLNCNYAAAALIGNLTVENTLTAGCTYPLYASDFATAVNVTAADCETFCQSYGGFTALSITNCIVTGATNWTGSDGPGPLPTPVIDHTTFQPSSAGLFQGVGGGSYYLIDGSTNRDSGSTNISPALAKALALKTTSPPIVYSNATISVDTTLSPQAQRITGQVSRGYAYDPLDWVFGGSTASANVTFAPGTTVGWFRNSSSWYHDGHGLHIDDAKTVTFDGRMEAPNYWVRCNEVQEGGTGQWEGGYGPGGLTGWAWPEITNSAQINARFTKFSMLAEDGSHYRDDNGWLIVNATHCEFFGGSVGFYNGQHHYTNCLFERTPIGVTTDHGGSAVSMRNCTLIGTVLSLTRFDDGDNAPVVVRECAFDGTAVTTSGGLTNLTYYDYNASQSTNETTPPGPNDLLITNFNWQVSLLGNYYFPSGSPLVDRGGVTTALAGLVYFTTQPSQSPDSDAVDLAYHFLSVDSNLNPIDSDGDGIPDYLEDPNGNGVVDSGETDPNDALDIGLKVRITRPKNNSILP